MLSVHALPLLVVLRSACRGLSAGWSLRVFVIGYQIGAESHHQLEAGLKGLPVEVVSRSGRASANAVRIERR